MGGHHDGDAFLLREILKNFDHLKPCDRIQLAGRLIGKDDLRAMRQRARNGDALLFAAGKLLRHMLGACAQPHHFQTLQGALLAVLGYARHAQGVFHIFLRVHHGNQRHGLKHKANLRAPKMRALLFAHAYDAFSRVEHIAFAGPVERAQDVHERGFA